MEDTKHLMKVGILHAIETEPDYFKPFFRSINAPFECVVYDVTRGEFPESPAVCDAFIVSGSAKGVYDSDPWIADLATFIKKIDQTQKKLVGICFGHQIIAHTLGGHASKSEKGWGLGLREFQITAQKPWMEPALDHCALYFLHQDQVKELPPGAEALGGDDFCPNTIYAIGDRVLGIQGHPEFPGSFVAYILEELKPEVGFELYDKGISSLDNGVPDAKTVGQWIINFLSR